MSVELDDQNASSEAGELRKTVKGKSACKPSQGKKIAADLLFDNQFYLFNLQCGPLIFEMRMKITLQQGKK